MHLLVGLGNPGAEYAANRHNVGFMVVDRLAGTAGETFRDKFSGQYARVRAGGDAILLKPQTFMNLSGRSVQAAMAFFKVPLDHVLVIHDELDLPFGTIRLKEGGGAAGHNGLRSIIECCGGPDFMRLRFGIGRPSRGSPKDFVLRDFTKSEGAELSGLLDEASRAAEAVVADGIRTAMNRFNVRPKTS